MANNNYRLKSLNSDGTKFTSWSEIKPISAYWVSKKPVVSWYIYRRRLKIQFCDINLNLTVSWEACLGSHLSKQLISSCSRSLSGRILAWGFMTNIILFLPRPAKYDVRMVTMTKTLHFKIYGLEMIAVVSIYLWLYWLWTFHDLDVKLFTMQILLTWTEPYHDHQYLICSRNSLIIFRANHVFVSAMCKHFSQLAKHPNFAAGMKFCIFMLEFKMLKC